LNPAGDFELIENEVDFQVEVEEPFEVVDLGDLDPDELLKLDPAQASLLMKPPQTKEKVIKFLEETKENWGRESVELKERVKVLG